MRYIGVRLWRHLNFLPVVLRRYIVGPGMRQIVSFLLELRVIPNTAGHLKP
jgi:hypothetical protein